MKNREAVARFTHGNKDGAGKCSNTAQPLTTIESEFNHG